MCSSDRFIFGFRQRSLFAGVFRSVSFIDDVNKQTIDIVG